MIAINDILVATDFSDVSNSALDYGRALARRFSARLHVLHVIDELNWRLMYGDGALVGAAPQVHAELEQRARRQLDVCVRPDDKRELGAVTVLRVGNSAAKEIVGYASEQAIDLLIIGATGRGTFDRLLTGSVADKVIRRAPCPVLAIRQPEREFIDPDALETAAARKA